MGWRTDDELQQMLRESAIGFLSESGGTEHFRAVRASGSGFDPSTWRQMGELGWTGMLLPEKWGGAELGLHAALPLAEELGRTISPEPFVASAVMAATLLAAGTGDATADLAGALVEGNRSIAVAWQEQVGVIGLPSFETRLVEGRLSGRKVHVGGWHKASALLVAAQGETGPVVVEVDAASSGVTVTTQRATDGTLVADIVFDGALVSAERVIVKGAAARAALKLAVARGTVTLSAQLEGLAHALWHRTLDYMQQRSQFGNRLSEFQALRHQMVDLYSHIELSAASWRRAAVAIENGDLRGPAVHAAKARCSHTAQDMARWAIQYHGAFGYTDEADVGLYVHCALRWASWLGNATTHRRAALIAHRHGKGA